MIDRIWNVAPRLLVAFLLISVAADAEERRAIQVAADELDLTEPGRLGRFLQRLPEAEIGSQQLRRLSRPTALIEFEPGHVQREAAADSNDRGGTRVWIFGARPRSGASFRYRCPTTDAAFLRTWLFTGAPTRRPWHFELTSGSQRFLLEIPGRRPQLLSYELPLGDPACAADELLTLRVAAPSTPRGFVMSPPLLVEPAERAPTPVILISVDTLRRDYWDGSASRPAALEVFLDDALRFTHAYSSFPTTPEAHSVLFSGRFFADVASRPLDAQLSLTSSLRDAGYATLGFVAGGYMRAGFGFGGREPGFALGFDAYVEDMQLVDPLKAREVDRHSDSLASERALQTHTLGPSLERSLRWLSEHSAEPFFHFVHGYDVHEYRSVDRRHWDAAAEDAARRGTDPATLRDCLARVGMAMDATLVVHHRFQEFESFRHRPLGDLEDCHRRVASLMYRGRVRSAEETLGRYLAALRSMGVYDRALIVVTSDHGESLLDETALGDARPHWGHNRILPNNLRVPLWIKPAGAPSRGRTIDRVVGLVDLRETLGDALGLEWGGGPGQNILAPPGAREQPIRFGSIRGDVGAVIEGGHLCSAGGDAEPRWSLYAGGQWRSATDAERERCRAALAGAEVRAAAEDPPRIPDELRDELRALGYVE